MKHTFYIYFFLFSVAGIAQNKQIDSLLSVLKTAREDSNKVNILYQLSELCDAEDILKYAEPSLKLSEKLNYKKGIANSFNNIGFVHSENGQVEKALEFYIHALKIQEEIGDKGKRLLTIILALFIKIKVR